MLLVVNPTYCLIAHGKTNQQHDHLREFSMQSLLNLKFSELCS